MCVLCVVVVVDCCCLLLCIGACGCVLVCMVVYWYVWLLFRIVLVGVDMCGYVARWLLLLRAVLVVVRC